MLCFQLVGAQWQVFPEDKVSPVIIYLGNIRVPAFGAYQSDGGSGGQVGKLTLRSPQDDTTLDYLLLGKETAATGGDN